MKTKCKTKTILAFTIALLLLSLFQTVHILEASTEVAVYVDPSLVEGVPVGGTFDIYVTAGTEEEPVVDLFLAEFTLSWDPPLLYTDVDSINLGDATPYLDFIYVEQVNNDEGWLKVTVGRPIGVKEGLSGTVQIAKITFLVEAEGSCDLHLYDIRLKDMGGTDLAHTTKDGRFASAPGIVLYVDPQMSTKPPGETFSIYVTASHVPADPPALWLLEAYMNFDPSILAVLDDPATTDDIEGVNTGDTEPYLEEIWIEKLDNTEGWVMVVVGRPLGVKIGLSGIVQIAKVTFEVKAEGSCDLHLYNTRVKYGMGYSHVDQPHETRDGYFTTIPFPHDVSVTSVTASPDTVSAGEPVFITVDVENQGTETESFGVTVYYGNTIIGTKTVTDLAAGASMTLEFTWDTTGVPEGAYMIKAEASVVPGETDTADNVFIDGRVTIVVHDIAIAFVEVYPTRVTPGQQQVYIDVEVVNEGTATETFDVKVYYDTTLIGTRTVWGLPSKASHWLKFVWDTIGVADGTYTISAEADVVPGETDTADNVYINGTVTVSVPKITVSPSSGPIGTKVTVKGSGFPYGMSGYLMFDDELVGFIFADIYETFNATLNVPLSEAGPHTIKAIILYYPYPRPVETAFTVIDVTPLEIEMDVGTLYFKGETAEFYVQTALKGTPTDVTFINALLYKPDETTEALTVQQIATGLYKMTYTIRGNGPMKGTYTLVVEASYTTSTVDATGTSIKTFLVKEPYKTWEKEAPTALSLIAAFGAISALVLVWRRKESTNPLQ